MAAEEAAPVDNIDATVQNGRNERIVVLGVILQVSILDNGDLTTGMGQATTHRSALPPIGGMADHRQIGDAIGCKSEELERLIRGVIIDGDDLLIIGNCGNTLENLGDRLSLVITGHDDREQWTLHRASVTTNGRTRKKFGDCTRGPRVSQRPIAVAPSHPYQV